ncbi:MAG: glycosyltransferase family 2 protein [Bacteroidaceae bacterium]|nr:glycosyltransferase family 2 protein [Bacteroidaceae bacterium]
MKRLSVIIVTYNSEHDIYDCLDSVARHCDVPAGDVEIVIVDNGSTARDAMFDAVRSRYGFDIVTVANDHNGGYGQGNNIGIRKASAPLLLIMNPDVRIVEPVFGTVLRAFEDDERLYMYGMKQLLAENRDSRHSFSFTYMMNGWLWVLLTGLCTRLDLFMPRFMYLTGSFFFVKKAEFESVGLFDESVFMYGEEDDIHFRLVHRFGPHIRYDSRHHYMHLVSGRKPSLKYEKAIFENLLYLHEKKGYSRLKTVRNFLRSTDIRLFRESVRVKMGKSDDLYQVLRGFRSYLKEYRDTIKSEGRKQ